MTENDYILLQQYLQGELGEKEQQLFAKRLKKEPDLTDALKWEQEATGFLQRETGRAKLRENFGAIEDDFFLEKEAAKVVPMARRRWARIVGLVAAAAVLLFIFNPFTSPDLYEKYAQPNPLSLTQRSDIQTLAQEAETAFNNQNYEAAYTSLTSYLAENQEDITAFLYKGLAATEIEKYEEAEQIFTEIRDGQSALKESGRWYLALLYVKKGELEKAKIELQNIPVGDYWKPKADALLNEL